MIIYTCDSILANKSCSAMFFMNINFCMFSNTCILQKLSFAQKVQMVSWPFPTVIEVTILTLYCLFNESLWQSNASLAGISKFAHNVTMLQSSPTYSNLLQPYSNLPLTPLDLSISLKRPPPPPRDLSECLEHIVH
jgi:hypothetical protein